MKRTWVALGLCGLLVGGPLVATPVFAATDKIEVAAVTYLQKHPEAIYIEVEEDLNKHFTGLMTPSKVLLYAVLNSYA